MNVRKLSLKQFGGVSPRFVPVYLPIPKAMHCFAAVGVLYFVKRPALFTFAGLMRLLLHILLLLLIAESTGLYQLVKLPKLYEHFREHQQLNPEVSLGAFLSMHYWGDDLNDDDDDKDMELPFKKDDTNSSALLYTPNARISVATIHDWPVEKSFGLERTDFYFNPAGQSLFRPPRA